MAEHDERPVCQVIRPAIHKDASDAHIEAVMKRTVFSVVSPTWVCWRPAGIHDDEVKRLFLSNSDMLTEERKRLYGLYRDGHRELPADHARLVAKELE